MGYQNEPGNFSAARDVKVAVAADKYNLPRLYEAALDHFARRFPIKLRNDGRLTANFIAASREAYNIDGPTAPFREAIITGLCSIELSEEASVSTSKIHAGLTSDLLRALHQRCSDTADFHLLAL